MAALCFEPVAVLAKHSFIWSSGGQWGEITSPLLWKFNSFLYLDTAHLEINGEVRTQGASVRTCPYSCCSPRAAFPARDVEIRGIQIWGASLCTAWEAGSCCWFPLLPWSRLSELHLGTLHLDHRRFCVVAWAGIFSCYALYTYVCTWTYLRCSAAFRQNDPQKKSLVHYKTMILQASCLNSYSCGAVYSICHVLQKNFPSSKIHLDTVDVIEVSYWRKSFESRQVRPYY